MYPTGKERDTLYTVTGQWSKAFEITEGSSKKGAVVDSYDADTSPTTPLIVAPIEEQDPLESRRAWSKVAQGIASGDMDFTGVEKSKIEVSQRELRIQEKNENRTWERRYFTLVQNDNTLDKLGPAIGVLPEADKTGGIWRFDEAKANALQSKSASSEKTPAPPVQQELK